MLISALFMYSLLGLGLSNLILGGIVLCSSARTHFIRAVRPDAPSEWPKLGYTHGVSDMEPI